MMTCVLRTVAGISQYVPAFHVPAYALVTGEKVFTGNFVTDTVQDGPSGSHARTIGLPRGHLAETAVLECVLRDVDGQAEYVPVDEVTELKPGERLFTGIFSRETVETGPSGSHKRTICAPLHVHETTVTKS